MYHVGIGCIQMAIPLLSDYLDKVAALDEIICASLGETVVQIGLEETEKDGIYNQFSTLKHGDVPRIHQS